MKTCIACKTVKPESEFYASQKARRCKPCCREYQRQWLAKHPGYMKERAAMSPGYGREWRLKHPGYHAERKREWLKSEKGREYENRRVQKRKGLVWPATSKPSSRKVMAKAYAAQRGLCAACSADLSKGFDRDHIVPICDGGLPVESNLQLLCKTCNRKKAAMGAVEYLLIAGLPLWCRWDPSITDPLPPGPSGPRRHCEPSTM